MVVLVREIIASITVVRRTELPPPSLAGEGGGGGSCPESVPGSGPLPNPPPQAGEGTASGAARFHQFLIFRGARELISNHRRRQLPAGEMGRQIVDHQLADGGAGLNRRAAVVGLQQHIGQCEEIRRNPW